MAGDPNLAYIDLVADGFLRVAGGKDIDWFGA
jgi:hypothetical protein